MQTTIVGTALRPTTVQLGLVQSIEQIGEAEAIEMLKSNKRNRLGVEWTQLAKSKSLLSGKEALKPESPTSRPAQPQ